MPFDQLWFSFGLTLTVALLQWWATRKLHRKLLAKAQARHLKAQQQADKLLLQSRQQNTQLQHELEAARLAMRRQRPAAPPPKPAPTREMLSRMLDEAPTRRTLPVDGFAETMPSMQFHPTGLGPI